MTTELFNGFLFRNHHRMFFALLLSCTLCIYTLTFFQNIYTLKNDALKHYNISANKPALVDSLSTINSTTSPISIYYRHATSSRNSSYPYISGDTFRAFSDYIYDETRKDQLNSVQFGEIIFIKTDLLSMFFSSPFESIRKPFVLVSYNSDLSAPNKYKSRLSDPKILKWYASNPSMQNHSKLIPIPIGLANRRWPEGNLDKIAYAFQNYRKPWSQRTSFLYVNFNIQNNKIIREKAMSQALRMENVQIIKKRISFDAYLKDIGDAKFVLSPPGGGLDCHRTWEALLMGAVPIVHRSELDPLFSKTRTVIIQEWSDLTQNLLLSLNFSLNEHILPDVLYAEYWQKTLFKYRSSKYKP